MTKEKDYFETFCRVSKAFGTTRSKKKLLDLIVNSAVETMGAKAACLFLADESEDIFIPVAQSGLSKSYLHAKPMPAKIVVSAILKGGHLYIKDATTDPRMENHEEKKREGIVSLLDVPVIVSDKAIGVLALYTGKTRKFSNTEIKFLSAMADQGGIAIENARLLDRILNNSMLFLDLASNINSSLDIKKIMNNLTVDICRALEFKCSAISLLDKDSGELALVASSGLNDAFLNNGAVSSTKSVAPALTGETLVIEDVALDNRIHYKKEIIAEGIVSMIVTPIQSRNEVIGVLRLFNDVKTKFPEDVITMVQALAHQGGLAIQNASMYLKLQETNASLEEDIWSHRQWF